VHHTVEPYVTVTPVAATLQQDHSLAPVLQVSPEMDFIVKVCQLLKQAYVLSWVLRD